MNDKHKVERNVPPPTGRPRSEPVYPWLTMSPGDSFTVEDRVAAASARGSFYRYQKLGKIPASYTVLQRTVGVNGDRTVRLWLMGDA